MALSPVDLKQLKDLPQAFRDWLRQLQQQVGSGAGGTIPWANVNKSGSNLNEIVTRNHVDTQNKQGGTTNQFYHLTLLEWQNQGYDTVTETGATHTIAAATKFFIANRAGTITVTLPSAATYDGRELSLKTIQAQTVVSNSSDVIPITGGAAGTAILPATAGAWALLVSNGTNWEIMAN